MTAATVSALYAAWLEADRAYRRRPSPGGRTAANEAHAAYLAGRDWHRGRSLEEVAARSATVPTEYTDARTVELFPDLTPIARDRALLVPGIARVQAALDLFASDHTNGGAK